jgi:AbrB family looped-hinge helix DNA binding protein
MKPKSSTRGERRYSHIVTLSTNGRLVIPKEIRDLLGVKSGDQLEIRLTEDEGHVFAELKAPDTQLREQHSR